MNEATNNVAATNSPVAVVAYTITRYDNGDIKVENASVPGTQNLSNEALYKDIEDVSEIIRNRRLENAAYRGIYRFYAEMEQREAQAAAEAAQNIDPTV